MTLDFATYRKVIDSLSPGLAYMEFHLGGENYMHRQAHEMVRYCRDRNPKCFILSSTNGHFFQTEQKVQELLDSGIDALIFSVDGARAESYARYRVNGRFDRVLDAMRRVARMRREQGRERPLIIWRYILLEWNDSKEEMDLARRLSKEVGADHLTWHCNAVETMASSKRFYIGSPHLGEIADELWDTLPSRMEVQVGVEFASYRDES